MLRKKVEPGTKIGPYTAIGPEAGRLHGHIPWKFRCECGLERLVAPARLKQRTVPGQRCGHRREPTPAPPAIGRPANDLAKIPCGSLTPLEVARQERNGENVWRCECSCGAITTVRASRLKSGDTTMCAECAAERRKTPDGYRIRDARLRARLTLEAAGELLGMSRQRVHQFENQIRVRECDWILKRLAAHGSFDGA